MATIYKKKNSSTPAVLTARVYDGDVEIYPTHRLAACINYKWYYDDLLGGGAVIIPNANSKAYTVDLTTVGSSGEYYCEIQIGATPPGGDSGCSNQTTERIRVSIVECLFQTPRTFNATNASAQVATVAPHYESPVFNNEGNSWITASGSIVSSCVGNICTYTQNITLADQSASANSARQGDVSLRTGTQVCYFGIGQDFIRNIEGDGVLPVQEPGPILTLTLRSGNVQTSDLAVIYARLTYNLSPNQTAPTIPDGDGEQVVFTADSGTLPASSRNFADLLSWRQMFTRDTPQTVNVTGTYTDPNGQTARHTIPVEFTSTSHLPTVFNTDHPYGHATGETRRMDHLNQTYINYQGNVVSRVGRHQAHIGAKVFGAGNWKMTVTIHPWGQQNPTRPTLDRDITLKVGEDMRHIAGPDQAWLDLAGQTLLTAYAGNNGAPVTRTFEFSGKGNYTTKLFFAYDLPHIANDDQNAEAVITINPND
jgi:hypothetical protein